MRSLSLVMVLFTACVPVEGEVEGARTQTLEPFIGDGHGWAANRPKQRKLWVIGERLWAFYADGQSLRYRTTLDGVAWSDATVVRAANFGHRFAVWFDGATLHYVFCEASPGQDVFYRAGVPGETEVSWLAEERMIFEVDDDRNVLYPNVFSDAASRVWVSFLLFEGGDHTLPGDGLVLRSDAPAGNWQLAEGFPHRLVEDNTETFPEPLGVPLENGDVVFGYNRDQDGYFTRAYSDGSWGEESALTRERTEHSLFALLNDGDEVHAAFMVGNGSIHHRLRDSSGAWSEDRLLANTVHGHPALTRIGPGHIFATFVERGEARLLGRELQAGVLGPLQLLADFSDESFPSHDKGWNLNALYEAGAGFSGAALVTVGSDDNPRLEVVVTR